MFLSHPIGTLGYVMSEVENGKLFSEVVRTAKNLGYTEPGKNRKITTSSTTLRLNLFYE